MSDEAVEKIKNELARIFGEDKESPSADGVAQKVTEILNGIGSKILKFKEFFSCKDDSED